MKAMIAVAALALLTCGAALAAPARPADSATEGAVNQASKADPDAGARLVGVWADDADCNLYASMHADGSFHSYSGGDGRWALAGGQLVMSGAGGEYSMQIRWLDADHLELTMQDGTIGHSHRCPDNGQ
ncbi:MAG: hypothetical protein ABUS57_04360 [Pseudomonadota bacterium]